MSDAPSSTMAGLTQDQLDAMAELHMRYLDGRIGGKRATLKNTDLSGLSLCNKDMRQADFMNCVMMKASEIFQNFRGFITVM